MGKHQKEEERQCEKGAVPPPLASSPGDVSDYNSNHYNNVDA